MKIFLDRAVAMREADKDAVMLVGDPSVMSQANIRVHVGPYNEQERSFGSRTGKNLRLAMLQGVYSHLLDDTQKSNLLTLKMQAGKAYSMFTGIEHRHGMWIDEGQDNSDRSASGVQPWNAGLVLKLAPGSASSKFSYRVEHGKEKVVTLKLQAVNTATNRVNIPPNPGFRSKTEASPYPRCGFYTQAEVNASSIPAFLIDSSLLSLFQLDVARVARYFVERAIAILKDPAAASPRTPQHDMVTKLVLNVGELDDSMTGSEAQFQLEGVVDELLTQCEGKSKTSKGCRIDLSFGGPDRASYFQGFQDGKDRCLCTGMAAGKACHFTAEAFATRLQSENPALFEFYVQRANQTAALTTALQKALGLKEAHPKRTNAYPRGSIFGWSMKPSQPKRTCAEKGVYTLRDMEREARTYPSAPPGNTEVEERAGPSSPTQADETPGPMKQLCVKRAASGGKISVNGKRPCTQANLSPRIDVNFGSREEGLYTVCNFECPQVQTHHIPKRWHLHTRHERRAHGRGSL